MVIRMCLRIYYRGKVDLKDISKVVNYMIAQARKRKLQCEIIRRGKKWNPLWNDYWMVLSEGIRIQIGNGSDPLNVCFDQEGNLILKEQAPNGMTILPQFRDPKIMFHDQLTNSVRTQYGGFQIHLTAIELLDELKKIVPNLKVEDESGYYQNRDLDALRKEFIVLDLSVDKMTDAAHRAVQDIKGHEERKTKLGDG